MSDYTQARQEYDRLERQEKRNPMTDPIAPDALREAVRDELAHWPIGSGYYSTSVALDEAGEMADAVLVVVAKHRDAEVERRRSRWVVQRSHVLAKVEKLLVTDAEIKSGTVHYDIGRMTPEWARDQATHWLAIAEYLDPEWPRAILTGADQ